jgi:hypothetical protein
VVFTEAELKAFENMRVLILKLAGEGNYIIPALDAIGIGITANLMQI